MLQDGRYLKEISRSLADILLLQKQKAQTPSQTKIDWRRVLTLVVLAAFILTLPRLINRIYKTTNNTSSAQNNRASLGMGDLIKQVQSEISKFDEERKKENVAPMFQLQTFELEISFVVKEGETQSGGVQYEVATVSNQTQTGSEHVQRLKLTMIVSPSYESAVGPSEPQHSEQVEVLGPLPPNKGENK